MKKNRTITAIGSVTALCALFMGTTGSLGTGDARAQAVPHDLVPGAAVRPQPAPLSPQKWNIEYEEDMRRDIVALTRFITEELAPVAGQSPEQALVIESIRGFDDALRGCYGAPGLADYAWALNHTLDESLPLFTMLEVMAEREENFPTGKDSDARLRHYHDLMEKYEYYYTRAARWLWDVNAAFAQTYPQAAEQVELMREQGKLETDLHTRAGADSYTASYPFAVTTPLRNRAQIFGPYVSIRRAQSAPVPDICP